jgi:hypothetical protein
MAKWRATTWVTPNGFFVLNPNLPFFLENSHGKYEKINFISTRFFTAVAVKTNKGIDINVLGIKI